MLLESRDISPANAGQRSLQASRHVRDVHVVMHVRTDDPRWWGKGACRDSQLVVSFEVSVGENVPGIPGACTTRNFAYLVRGPLTWRIYQETIGHFSFVHMEKLPFQGCMLRGLSICSILRSMEMKQQRGNSFYGMFLHLCSYVAFVVTTVFHGEVYGTKWSLTKNRKYVHIIHNDAFTHCLVDASVGMELTGSFHIFNIPTRKTYAPMLTKEALISN